MGIATTAFYLGDTTTLKGMDSMVSAAAAQKDGYVLLLDGRYKPRPWSEDGISWPVMPVSKLVVAWGQSAPKRAIAGLEIIKDPDGTREDFLRALLDEDSDGVVVVVNRAGEVAKFQRTYPEKAQLNYTGVRDKQSGKMITAYDLSFIK